MLQFLKNKLTKYIWPPLDKHELDCAYSPLWTINHCCAIFFITQFQFLQLKYPLWEWVTWLQGSCKLYRLHNTVSVLTIETPLLRMTTLNFCLTRSTSSAMNWRILTFTHTHTLTFVVGESPGCKAAASYSWNIPDENESPRCKATASYISHSGW